MKHHRLAAVATLLAISSAAHATSLMTLEEVYAKRCSDPVAASSKGCVTFRRELDAEWAKQGGAAPAAKAPATPAPAASAANDATHVSGDTGAAELARAWGALGVAAGHAFESDAYTVLVWWVEPGQRLAVDWFVRGTARPQLSYRFTRGDTPGTLKSERGPDYQVLADGTVWTERGRNHAWVLTPDGQFVLAKGSVADGVFTRSGEFLAPAKRVSGEQANALWARLLPTQAPPAAVVQATPGSAPAAAPASPPVAVAATPMRATTASAVAPLPGASTSTSTSTSTPASAAVTAAPPTAIAPLPGSSTAASAAPVAAPAAGEVPELWKKRFGPFAGFGGKATATEIMGKVSITTYAWKVPGEKMEIVSYVPTGAVIKSTLTWQEADQRIEVAVAGTISASGGSYMTIQPDGAAMSAAVAYPQYRSISRLRPDGSLEGISEENKGGVWTAIAPPNVARLYDGPRPTVATVAAAPHYDLAPVAGYDVATWGPLARFVDTTWSDNTEGKAPMLARSIRVDRADGTAALKVTVTMGPIADTYVLRPGATPGTLSAEWSQSTNGTPGLSVSGIVFVRESDDVLRSKPYTTYGSTFHTLLARGSRGDLWFEQGIADARGATVFPMERQILAANEDPDAVDATVGVRFRRVSRDVALAQDRAGAADNNRAAQESIRQYQAEQEAKRPKNSGGGAMLGKLFVMSAGAAAAVAGGGNTEQIIGGALKGAQIAGVQGVGGAADTLLTSGAGAANAAGGSSGAAGASFATKPNLATSACAGFNESNYRTKALEGGPDTQLLTMCGQAFEYYTMYKRAMSQGYSEADCNRTYAAHEDSARVAISYRRTGG